MASNLSYDIYLNKYSKYRNAIEKRGGEPILDRPLAREEFEVYMNAMQEEEEKQGIKSSNRARAEKLARENVFQYSDAQVDNTLAAIEKHIGDGDTQYFQFADITATDLRINSKKGQHFWDFVEDLRHNGVDIAKEVFGSK